MAHNPAPWFDDQAYVASYSLEGALEWVRSIGDNCDDKATSVVLSEDGSAVVAGDYVDILNNPIDCTDEKVMSDINALVQRGVDVMSDCL